MDYYENSAISQSFLKNVLKNYFGKDENDSMQRGSLIDHFLFIGTDIDTYDGEINKYCELAMLVEGEITPQKILDQVRLKKYNDNYLDKTHLANIEKIQPFLDWYEPGKKVYTTKEVNFAKEKVEFIKNSEHYKFLVRDENIYQVSLFGEYQNTSLKGLIDWIAIDHQQKKILLIDLKTSHYNKIDLFSLSVKEYRYDFQMAFYKYLVEVNYKELLAAGYELEIYWLGYNFNKTFLWRVSDIDLDIGENGCVKLSGDYIDGLGNSYGSSFQIYGWKQALDIYNKALATQSPDYDLEYISNKGYITKSTYVG